ncbi:MAG: GAF domain-containing protein [Anaerolineae bacterium]|nr:GAF domain-containing protein [Anaerolineae bacterium]
MPILLRATEVLSTTQGSLVYHLLVFWAVMAGAAMALGEWRRTRQEHTYRLALALSGFAAARAVYAVGALFAAWNWVSPVVLLPPLERCIDTASLAFLVWALVPAGRWSMRQWHTVLVVVLALMGGTCAILVSQWAEALAAGSAPAYNPFWQAWLWAVLQLGASLLAGYLVVRRRPAAWGIYLAGVIMFIIGICAQWWLGQWPYPATAPHIPVWQRLATLVAYPLVAFAVYQDVVAGLRVQSRELQDISQASLDQIKSLLYLFEASQQTFSSLDLPMVLDNAVRGIARVLNADQCAIAFPEEGNTGQMRLVAIHNPVRQGRGEAVAFPLEYQLTVQQAIRRRRHIVVENSDNVQLKVLFALLGSAETGPLLVQPLMGDRETVGAIIVGNSRSHRPFGANEVKLCQSMSEQVATAVQNARRYQASQQAMQELAKAQAEDQKALRQARTQIEELTGRLAETRAQADEIERRELAAREVRNAIEIKLASSRAEVDALSERLSVLESDLAQAHASSQAQTRWHEHELGRLENEWEDSLLATQISQAVIQGMTAGVLVTDEKGQIELMNVAAEILMDLGREEIEGLPLEEIGEDVRWKQAVATAAAGEAVRVTLRLGMNTLMCDVAPLPEPDQAMDTTGRLVAILQDITTEAQEQQDRLATVAQIADDLRTPITTIGNYADLLLNSEVDVPSERKGHFLSRIKAGVDQISALVTGIADITNLEGVWSRPERHPIEIAGLVDLALADSRAYFEDRDLTIEIDLPPDLPEVAADHDYMRRILGNLLTNASLASSLGGQVRVQATHTHTPPIQSDGRRLDGELFVMVSVQDSGGGLSDEALGRVFDRARPRGKPTGLGGSGADMALVKALVEAHGGRLWVESDPGVGTTFRFVLPVNNQLEDAYRAI